MKAEKTCAIYALNYITPSMSELAQRKRKGSFVISLSREIPNEPWTPLHELKPQINTDRNVSVKNEQ